MTIAIDAGASLELDEDYSTSLSPNLAVRQEWAEASFVPSLSRVRSAPLLSAPAAATTSVWYTSTSQQSPKSTWKPLAGKWRAWEVNAVNQKVRKGPDDLLGFSQGVVPRWFKGSMVHTKQILAHELAWAYQRTKRTLNPKHPLRQELGEKLPLDALIGKMRYGGTTFQFWRDLRPPFEVTEVKQLEGEEQLEHLDCPLYQVYWECAVEYEKERLLDSGPGGTYDNKIRGAVKMRIPVQFPESRSVTIESWGAPSFTNPEVGDKAKEAVDPWLWMPIADELQIRASAPRLAKSRAETRIASIRARYDDLKNGETSELQRIALGPHQPLPLLAAAEQRAIAAATGGLSPDRRVKKRLHTIFTSSSGFVKYLG